MRTPTITTTSSPLGAIPLRPMFGEGRPLETDSYSRSHKKFMKARRLAGNEGGEGGFELPNLKAHRDSLNSI